MNYLEIRKQCQKLADKKKADIHYQYFQVKKGGYGYGDRFYGLTVPQCRLIAKKQANLSFGGISKLIKSPYHEERFIALVILTLRFKDEDNKVYHFYLNNLEKINNWDLVDVSAYKIIGKYLVLNSSQRGVLYKLIKSNNLWHRRIAIVSTLSLIKEGNYDDILRLAKLSLNDKEDLIHKASGWMLREVGKKNEARLLNFLNKHHQKMPRVMLRYSLEKVGNRGKYLKKPLKKD